MSNIFIVKKKQKQRKKLSCDQVEGVKPNDSFLTFQNGPST